MTAKRLSVSRWGAWLLVVVGCADAAPGNREAQSSFQRDSLSDGTVIARNAAQPAQGEVAAVRTLSIGAAQGDARYLLYKVWDLEADRDGSIYVADAGRKEVLVYDSAGAFLRAFGREGDGPGEFRLPSQIGWIGDHLWVFDPIHSRLSTFTRDGDLLEDTTFQDLHNVQKIAWTGTGRLLIQVGPNWAAGPADREENGVARVLSIGLRAGERDTLVSWNDSAATAHLSAPGRSFIASIPFAPRSMWAPRPDGGIYYSDGVRYRILHYAPDGRVVGEIRRPYQAIRVNRAERDSARARIAAVAGQFGRELNKLMSVPDRKPALLDLLVDGQGCLWVQASTPQTAEQEWDLFTPAGRYTAAVHIPDGVRLFRIVGSSMYGVRHDSLGVTSIEVYRHGLDCGDVD